MRTTKQILFTALLVAINATVMAQTDSSKVSDDDIFEMSLEDLLGIEVTSVSKKAERLQDVASSIYVLTTADIESSGATTIHELLRSVPGYWGVQEGYSDVSEQIRNSPTFSGNGSVLYLLDGTPLQDNMSSSFSFNNFDIPLDEIDRIEVIRGSGGTVYGANSATGVVNIFTKNPEKYDGVTTKVEYALPGYTNFSLRAGGKINDKLSISGYGKARLFEGYGLFNEFKGDSVLAPLGDTTYTGHPTGDSTMIKNRFTEDFDKIQMYSGGLKLVYKMSKKSKISFNSHVNVAQQKEYTNFDTDLVLLGASDSLVLNEVTRSRMIGNLRFDHSFSDNHSIFARISTNMENDFQKTLGGFKLNNSMYDIEIQDNMSIGKYNNLSVGANYRIVNFDINDINDTEGFVYLNPKNSEASNGIFIQNKVKLIDSKLNFHLGIKAETYSLVNDDYYLSPMAKVSMIPVDNLTIWGGYTQSYTTPGYNTTNIDFLPLRTLSDATVNGLATQGVYGNVYAGAFAAAVGGGADSTSAAGIADAQATGFLGTPAGAAAVDGAADGIRAGLPNNVGVKNGGTTEPTKYETWEIGFRANLEKTFAFESNFYYTTITDNISPSNSTILLNSPSSGFEGISADYFLYGNYQKGIMYGTETTIKIATSEGVKFEVSHIYTHSEWEFQENSDFDINDPAVVDPANIDQTPSTPVMPKHVFRLRGMFKLPSNFSLNSEVIFASNFDTENNYQYESQRYPNILGSSGGVTVAENNSRTIINMKLQKSFMDKKLTTYIFGNDIFNEGIVANTNTLGSVTLSQISGMYGVGISYKF